MMSSESGKSLLPSALPEGGVLVVSGDTIWRDRVIQDLRGQEHLVGIAGGGADALHRLDSGHWSTLLLERELVDLDARDIAEFATRKYPNLAVRFLVPVPQPGRTAPKSSQSTPSGLKATVRPSIG